MKELSSSLKKYLLVIYELSQKNSEVYRIDIAVALGYSKASVTSAISRLIDLQYILDDHKKIILTSKGYEETKKIDTYYQTFYKMLRKHEFSVYEARNYALEMVCITDHNFFIKLNDYHHKNHIDTIE